MTALAIESIGLAKHYKTFFGAPQRALDGMELSVPRGIAFGLIGPNGAGKTTFIKVMLGLVRPTRGEVRLLGGRPEDRDVRARIGYLPERLELPPAWTPRQFLRSVARLKSLSMLDGEIETAIDRVGLLADAHRKTGDFSKGMKQRLGLAGALLGRPELLVLDEPTDGLDPMARADVRAILSAERNRGVTVFLNSHLLTETERICDRVGILAKGRIVREGTLDTLRAAETRWLARFEGEESAALALAGFAPTETPRCYAWRGDDATALNAAIDSARASGARLIELTRDQKDLEHVLSDALGAQR